MAGVEEESQFESKIKYTFGRSRWIPNPEKNTLECCIEVAAYAKSLTEKLTKGTAMSEIGFLFLKLGNKFERTD